MTLRSNLVSISSCWSRTTKWVFVSLLSGYSAHNIRLLRFNLLFWGLSWKDFLGCNYMFLMINVFSVIQFPWNIVSARNQIPHTQPMRTQRCHPQMAGAAAGKLHRIDHALAHRNRINSDKKNFGVFFNEWVNYAYLWENIPKKYRQESFCFLLKRPKGGEIA